MEGIILVFFKVLPIILLLLLGVWMRRKDFVSAQVFGGIKKITLNVAIPAILFLTFFRKQGGRTCLFPRSCAGVSG
ncbi:MAG: hypothetical protein AB9880_11920 [Christensenellales bacterium]